MDQKLEKIISDIYADAKVSPKEVIELNKFAKRAIEDLLSIEGDNSVTSAMCKSFEITNQLVQTTSIKMRKQQESLLVKNLLKRVIESQVELLEANMKLFT
ncbi:hypothetical protein [Tenacibaculum sp. C7A-26P2]|uniref:hypothetical protein n=1 Tax=Tenacibaculum sp. C7A-26P2 TaxID=3447504 RepID=UPI003F82FD07